MIAAHEANVQYAAVGGQENLNQRYVKKKYQEAIILMFILRRLFCRGEWTTFLQWRHNLTKVRYNRLYSGFSRVKSENLLPRSNSTVSFVLLVFFAGYWATSEKNLFPNIPFYIQAILGQRKQFFKEEKGSSFRTETKKFDHRRPRPSTQPLLRKSVKTPRLPRVRSIVAIEPTGV